MNRTPFDGWLDARAALAHAEIALLFAQNPQERDRLTFVISKIRPLVSENNTK